MKRRISLSRRGALKTAALTFLGSGAAAFGATRIIDPEFRKTQDYIDRIIQAKDPETARRILEEIQESGVLSKPGGSPPNTREQVCPGGHKCPSMKPCADFSPDGHCKNYTPETHCPLEVCPGQVCERHTCKAHGCPGQAPGSCDPFKKKEN